MVYEATKSQALGSQGTWNEKHVEQLGSAFPLFPTSPRGVTKYHENLRYHPGACPDQHRQVQKKAERGFCACPASGHDHLLKEEVKKNATRLN